MAAASASKLPRLNYGTAWKKERTRTLVKQAITAGFRGVDTAAQPKHYQEDLVGLGIQDALRETGLKRRDLYLQTKFTSVYGQDPTKMPYDPKTSITDQVNTSVASSLRNLGPAEGEVQDSSYIDCLVLHSPFPSPTQTEEAWRAMETHVPNSVRTLGISNVYNLSTLEELYKLASVKPSVVQNRFFRDTGYDHEIREFCAEKDITYQSFWTLTANPQLLMSEPTRELAKAVGVSLPVALYGFVLGLGKVSVLDGTTNAERMHEDLAGIEKINEWRSAHVSDWSQLQNAFDALLAA
ncbi:Aldo/keto reductase [Hortaea werneckii]|nr:Aldo/keto reductase [Hortaea werneckii]KAI6852866.1 Aldo/keto reductase [Hortaea werneckii]KAI6944788.1 Aldo/keto reductase [Hortaea werneckii]KAI6950967.1 Aldo/keto reductase [Hortaea werneckii]KAI6982866.1 Aldo/keto reductase [Hortaea werneckii]